LYIYRPSNKQTLDAAKATKPYGFLVKPFREKDVLVMLEIARYLHQNGLESAIKKERAPTTGKKPGTSISPDNFCGIIGKSRVLKDVLQHLEIVAPTDTSVLILGETGTGKERIAECIHELSGRSKKPLVKVNCAALPFTLIESILFGHEKGTFTGAHERKIGKFEQADGGTIFLDEIGEMPLDVQVKLLRVLQEREIERMGSNVTINVYVRIIAATNLTLEDEVAERRFRMDLYYRLNVFPLLVPSLRERREDIPLLTNHFIDYYCRKIGKNALQITEQAMELLTAYFWPGNIRELEHTMERATLLEKGSVIKNIYLPQEKTKEPVTINRMKTMEENERDHIVETLKQCQGKIFGKGGAAEILGINASTLNSRIKKLGIEKSLKFSS
jgi:transcriptional regulator with GAF, ATPase, and Fis domain